jgi:wyosine [tRNA(Phe)-imidazoG37] synthetase (radical SAM superfamily)
MDKYSIDNHKLHFHIDRVYGWMHGENIYPVYMEVSPAGMCNHRCVFCGLDFMGYQHRYLDKDLIEARFSEMGDLGLKSIMLSGEGEPFLHKDIAGIIESSNNAGIDVAVTTNGVLMRPEIMERTLDKIKWIKVSCNGGSAETYSKVHRTDEKDFQKVIENLKACVNMQDGIDEKCTLGIQILLLPENSHEIELLANIAHDIGLNYIVVKPYSHHPQSRTEKFKQISYKDYLGLSEKLENLNTEQFHVVFRTRAMRKWDEKKITYDRCLAFPFWSYLDAGGNIWGCSIYLNDERFFYGNIYESSFEEIWGGEKRMKSLKWCAENLDPHECRINCRMDEINRYLWNLKNPSTHVNFI